MSSPFVVSGSRSKSSQPWTSLKRARQNALSRSTSASPARSRESCSARSSSRLIGDGAVPNLEHRVQDLETLVELGLGDARRTGGGEPVPPHERVHAGIDQSLADRV